MQQFGRATAANGIPLAVILTGGNRHDVTQLLPLIEAIPPIRGRHDPWSSRTAWSAPLPGSTTGAGFGSAPNAEPTSITPYSPWPARRSATDGSF